MSVAQAVIQTAVGPIRLAGTQAGLSAAQFQDADTPVTPVPDVLHDAARQLEAYFAGKRREFTLALAPEGTEFQKRVWDELVKIPFGETISYAELARRVGGPTFTRAVGLANGANPIGVIVPCHRVIGSSGELVGYAGGLHRKQWLLAHEQRVLGKPAQATLF